MLKQRTTTIRTLLHDRDVFLSGEERYPIAGLAVSEEQVIEILQSYKDCLEKSRRAREILGQGVIVVGAMQVHSWDYKSSYGYFWNPPLEFHSWLLLPRQKAFFDASLPGVIERGLKTYDEVGPSIAGREPVVLAGMPKKWMTYRVMQLVIERG